MSSWEKSFEKWSSYQDLDSSLRMDLDNLKGETDKIEDAFYKELSFGTGGMRGILGPGTNRMNIYTIRKAVCGLANYLKVNCVNVKDRGVVISYDSRYMSQEFAVETAKVLGFNGIRAYVFDTLHPTPILSFAVRYLGACAGVMITASHNPPEYNGFKVYNEDGGQVTPAEANDIIARVESIENELAVSFMDEKELEEKELINWLGSEIDNAYLEKLQSITKFDQNDLKKAKDLQIVFTPLHGTAHDLVIKGLMQLNFPHVHVVEEQKEPDPEFSTVASPNPEEHQAFTLAIKQGEKYNADILIGTDPDADRLGVAVKDEKGAYTVLTGNQLGSLLLDYILSHSDPTMLANARMIKTIVTTGLGRSIADGYGVQTLDTLTGFKFIGEKIRHFDATGETFIFGFEESYGYLISAFARDKDAVQAAMLACEMAYYWKERGKTLLDALAMLYEEHGYYKEGMTSLTLKGKEGSRQIAAIMTEAREHPFSEIAGLKVEKIEDYLTGERIDCTNHIKEIIQLPQENVIKYVLEQDCWVCLRPSGTEPKIKCYYGVCGNTSEESEQTLAALKDVMDGIMNNVIQAN